MILIDNSILFPGTLKSFMLFPECSIGISILYVVLVITLIIYNVYGIFLQKASSECLALVLIMSCYLIYNDDLMCLGMFKRLGPYIIFEMPWSSFNGFFENTSLVFFTKFLICLFSVAFFLSSSDSSDAVKEGPKGLSDWLKEIPKKLSDGFKKRLGELSEKLKEELKKFPDKLRNLWEILIKLSLPQLIMVLLPYYLWLKWIVVILTWPKIIRFKCLLVFLILAPSEPLYAYPIKRLSALAFLKFLNIFIFC